MTRDSLERLLLDVTDEELESLRDAILREEGRRRSRCHLTIKAPFPPLVCDQAQANTVERWARLITWLAKDQDIPPAQGKRGVMIRLTYSEQPPDATEAGIVLQQALVQAGLLRGRMPEWMDAAVTQVEAAEMDAVHIMLWDKPLHAAG